MKLACHLREMRGDRTLLAIVGAAAEAGTVVSEADLSRIERGIALPRDDQLPGLEAAYGAPRYEWWPPQVLVALSGDEA